LGDIFVYGHGVGLPIGAAGLAASAVMIWFFWRVPGPWSGPVILGLD
jgi:hypothetical protein